MKITWVRCLTYEGAKTYSRVIYLHEWDGSPFYWGIADGCKFDKRYGPSYSHWVEGSLQHGGRLYIGQVTNLNGNSLESVEYALINRFGSSQNKRTKETPLDAESFVHDGDVPASIERDRR